MENAEPVVKMGRTALTFVATTSGGGVHQRIVELEKLMQGSDEALLLWALLYKLDEGVQCLRRMEATADGARRTAQEQDPTKLMRDAFETMKDLGIVPKD